MSRDLSSFKKFLSSRDALLRAVNSPPVSTREYKMSKYVKFPVMEGNQRREISLKPSNVMKIKWLYESAENPIALKIELDGQSVKSNFSGKKLYDWVTRYSSDK